MPSRVNPAELTGKPLVLRRLAAEDFAAKIDSRPLGQIMGKPLAGGGQVRFSTLTSL